MKGMVRVGKFTVLDFGGETISNNGKTSRYGKPNEMNLMVVVGEEVKDL